MELLDRRRVRATAKLWIFSGWLLAGIVGVFYAVVGWQDLGLRSAILLLLICSFLIVYGSWAVKRAWREFKR
ncbi:hypothetical protein HYW68_02480 [Candidatus Parcubacteria bacterium]|nr:hypothetical protein [Candidatus Parcubacteria bacterium]